jgi:glycosyltransferase involved in cell wall biosynthesis
METSTTVNVIIPTYNRKAWLLQTLESLASQSYPPARFEVLVIDDGSTDDTALVAAMDFPFRLKYVWQENQGDAAARNTGVLHSQADVLVFIDDDIILAPEYLRYLVREHQQDHCRIVVGNDQLWLEEDHPLEVGAARPITFGKNGESRRAELETIQFQDVCSNNMSIRREGYLAIGMMSGLGFSGSSIWCDVDFTYRAYQKGFSFFRSPGAICWHRDYVAQSLENSTKRMRETAFRAAALFQKHPNLLPHLAMFDDKTPIAWRQDSPRLVARKLARRLASTKPALSGMEQAAGFLSRKQLSPALVENLSKWIVGGYLYQGYREGLRQIALTDNHHE